MMSPILLVALIFGGVLALGAKAVAAPAPADTSSSGDVRLFYVPLLRKYSGIHGVPWRWMLSIMGNESDYGRNWRVRAGLVSSDGKSYGVMQVTVETFAWLNDKYRLGYGLSEAKLYSEDEAESQRALGAELLNQPEVSVRVAAIYLRYLMDRFGGDREKTVRAYNGGPGFASTPRGISDTPIYYKNFLKHLAEVMQLAPGNELERG